MQTPASRTRAYGLSLFVVYLLLYAGFIALNVARPDIMAERVRGGVTVAVAYGMLLIFSAAALALVYMVRSRNDHT